jgi:hypothetical protein
VGKVDGFRYGENKMNTYKTTFIKNCPTNNLPISYTLEIKNYKTIIVEELLSFLEQQQNCYHEDLADKLIRKFGGNQKMIAFHHGVEITTERQSWSTSI